MLPHIAGRPLSLVRCPDGVAGSCFFQKHATGTLPQGIESVLVTDKKTGKLEPYITLSTPTALAELAQMGVLEIHPWGSRNDDLEHPDRITIDLDPDAAISWQQLAASAADVRKQLKDLGLESFLKTTGGKGLHVVIPIRPEHGVAGGQAVRPRLRARYGKARSRHLPDQNDQIRPRRTDLYSTICATNEAQPRLPCLLSSCAARRGRFSTTALE